MTIADLNNLANNWNPVEFIGVVLGIVAIIWRGIFVWKNYQLKRDFNNDLVMILAFGITLFDGSYTFSKLKPKKSKRLDEV